MMKRIGFLLVLALGAACVKPALFASASGTKTPFPCGVGGEPCSNGTCCSENFTCGGEDPTCPVGACCYVGPASWPPVDGGRVMALERPLR
jgi:hypothetical protein